jgi:invasion protein IalB
MPRASPRRAARIVISLIRTILPGFVPRGECYGKTMTKSRRLSLTLRVLLVILLALATPVDAADKKSGNAAPASPAATTQRLGASEGWTAYAYKEKSGQVCYLAGEPQKSEPKEAKRKTPRAMVTHRPDEKVANVVSFAAGLPLKEGSDASVDIGGTKFDLFTKGDSAWARTADLDKSIVEAMAKGKQAVVKGIPQKGQTVTDTYSLAGFTQALAMIDKACSIKR